MSRISEVFEKAKKPLFIAFTVAGDPDPQRSVAVARTLIDAGADILEFGVPFSDPVADGPTIQRADERALSAGINPDLVFGIVREVRAYSKIPIVLLTYYNIVYRKGVETFCSQASEAGVDGILVADLPVEESNGVCTAARRYGIDQIFLVAPTTSTERLKRIRERATGFLYLISLLGVTGARDQISASAAELIGRVREETTLPLAVGFGISRPEHIRALSSAGADAAIVGSAIVDIIEKNLGDDSAMMRELHRYVGAMCGIGGEVPFSGPDSP